MKVLLLIAVLFIGGCTGLDTSLATINNYAVSFILNDSEIDKDIPKFRPGAVYYGKYNPEISKTFHNELKIFSDNFKKYYTVANKILLSGYIDSDEKMRGFNNLGKKRAEEVMIVLMKLGIPKEVILLNDLGGKKYFNSNSTEIEKAKNRCVTIEVYKEK